MEKKNRGRGIRLIPEGDERMDFRVSDRGEILTPGVARARLRDKDSWLTQGTGLMWDTDGKNRFRKLSSRSD